MTSKSQHRTGRGLFQRKKAENESRTNALSRRRSKNALTPIPTIKTTLVLVIVVLAALVLISAQPATASGQKLLPTQPSNTRTMSPALLIAASLIVALTHVQLVGSIPPVEELVLRIVASNRTSEEKFQAVLLLQHGRYCGSSRSCQRPNNGVGGCGYCKPCRCDDLCLQYGDCCPDKLIENVGTVSVDLMIVHFIPCFAAERRGRGGGGGDGNKGGSGRGEEGGEGGCLSLARRGAPLKKNNNKKKPTTYSDNLFEYVNMVDVDLLTVHLAQCLRYSLNFHAAFPFNFHRSGNEVQTYFFF